MTGTTALALYTAFLGLAAPRLLRRSHWPQRAPGPAVALWLGLMLSFVTALALLVHHLVVPEHHLHHGLLGYLHACGTAGRAALGRLDDTARMLAPFTVAVWALGWYGLVLLRARRDRRRHARLLDLVARPHTELPALVLDHDVPAVYCLPGRARRIVLTRGALDALSGPQLRAVLAHEHAHLTGRHHLLTAAADAFARAFPLLPLGALGRPQTAALLEMAADDRAVRSHPRRVLATAMGAVAAGRAPAFGLAVTGSPVVARVRRLVTPVRTPHPLTSTAVALTTLAAPVVPFLFTCA